MKIDKTEYIRAHGKEPKGRGTWAFTLRCKHGAKPLTVYCYGTLTQCIKNIKETHGTANIATLTVLS